MVPIKPKMPNSIGAAARYLTIRGRATALANSFAQLIQGNGQSRFEVWREVQLRAFIKHATLYAIDLQIAYQNDRLGPAAQAMRNLMEIYIWAQYTRKSEENAKRFFQDAARDMRDTMETLQKLYTHQNKAPEEKLDSLLGEMKVKFAEFQVEGYEDGFTRLSDAAKEVGKDVTHGTIYKVASKFAHPTALLLVVENPVPGLIDSFYEGGVDLAHTCLTEVEGSIKDVFPDFAVGT